MEWVYIVYYDNDYGDGPYICAVFSSSEKARKYIARRMEENEDGMPLYEYDSFFIEAAEVDVDDDDET